MTYEEQHQYDNLSYYQKQDYDRYKSQHPGWSHKQIMFKIGMDKTAEKIADRGGDPNPEDPQILKEILEGAKSFLIGVGIVVGTIISIIDDALETLGGLIYEGISYVGNKLQEFWDWLWD